METQQFKPGDKVHYVPTVGKPENGIIKAFSTEGDTAWVVYKCAGNWDNYQNYTGQSTWISDLRPGWVDEDFNKHDVE